MAAGVSCPAWSQVLTDPTRPPSGLGSGEVEAPAVTGSALTLQSVMISPTLKAAIINGEMVKLGGQIGSARLVKVTESEVVLKEGDETQVLKLYPGVDKRDAREAANSGARGARAPATKPGAPVPGGAAR